MKNQVFSYSASHLFSASLFYFFGIIHNPIALANSCPYMAGQYVCSVEENSTTITWPMTVTQRQNGIETIFDFYHGPNVPEGGILHLTNIASDQGAVNNDASDPNLKYISKCAGDRIDYYLVGATSPYGTDRLNEEGNWIGCNYDSTGCNVGVTICLRKPTL
jgi:hypothetical protein